MDKNKNSEKYKKITKELENQILLKLKAIETKLLTEAVDPLINIQILTLVTDELDDVLLNWETPAIRRVHSEYFDDDLLDEDDY
jgi:hypothetical protein